LSAARREDGGSMFVEAIMAAAIAALALGATFRVIVDSAERERGVEARLAALQIAQSELADVGAEIPLAPGQTAGVAGALVWRVDIAPYAEGPDDSAAGQLLEVRVTVGPRFGGARLVKLESLRLVPTT
jgi:hypothetical protein